MSPHVCTLSTPLQTFLTLLSFSPQECVCSHVTVSKSQDEGTGRCLYILTQAPKRLKRTREVAGTDFDFDFALFLAYWIFARGRVAVNDLLHLQLELETRNWPVGIHQPIKMGWIAYGYTIHRRFHVNISNWVIAEKMGEKTVVIVLFDVRNERFFYRHGFRFCSGCYLGALS